MAERVSTRLTSAEGRKFGFTIGFAFLVLGGLAWWRAQHTLAAAFEIPPAWSGRHRLAVTLAVAGALLVVAGLAAPTRVGPIERAWSAMSHGISRVTTPVFMALVYFGVLTPIGWLMRVSGKSLLVAAPDQPSVWTVRTQRQGDMKRQF